MDKKENEDLRLVVTSRLQQRAGSKKERYILIVDDEADVIRSLMRELSYWAQAAGINLAGAILGDDAIEFLERHKEEVEVLIFDMRMPGMTGSKLLEQIHNSYPDVVPILLTAYNDREQIARAVKAGLFSFIPKPWETDQIIAEIEKAMEYRKERKEKRRYMRLLEDHLRWGSGFQHQLLSVELPQSKAYAFSLNHYPEKNNYCGGAYYDVIPLGSERYLVLSGDVAGNGLLGAFVTVMLKAIIQKDYVYPCLAEKKNISPAAFLEWLNERMCFYFNKFPYLLVTFTAALFDASKKNIQMANAGHVPLFRLSKRKIEALRINGTSLGVVEELQYEDVSYDLGAGDIVLFPSDGLIRHSGAEGEMEDWFKENIIGNALSEETAIENINERLSKTGEADSFKRSVALISVQVK